MNRALLPALLVLSCAAQRDPPQAAETRLGPDDCAAVDDDRIAVATVAGIARAQGVPPRQALKLAVRDALFAAEAERTLVGSAQLQSSARARALLVRLKEQADASGPPSDQEIARLSAERWADVDRPPSARTTHAVVLTGPGQDAARARQLAERVARAVAGITDPQRFIEAARAVDVSGFELRAERLPFIAVDGRALPGPDVRAGASFDPDYARAANALTEPGAQSAPIQTRFGFHVILLEEKLPRLELSPEERRNLFEAEIRVRRARTLERNLLDQLKRERPVELSRAAAELMAKVRVSE